MKWGSIGFEENERDRPQFHGLRIKSPVDDSDFVYFPEDEFERRKYIVMSVVGLALCIVFLIVGCTFYLQWFMNQPSEIKKFTVANFNTSVLVTPLINSAVIGVSSSFSG
jgi:hypothetical protein